mgnify:FL=1
MGKTIGIYFCGGCNSKIDRVQIAESLTKKLEKDGFKIILNPSFSVDYLITLSGCSAECASKYRQGVVGAVSVGGEKVESWPCPADRIVSEIMDRVRDYFERLAK